MRGCLVEGHADKAIATAVSAAAAGAKRTDQREPLCRREGHRLVRTKVEWCAWSAARGEPDLTRTAECFRAGRQRWVVVLPQLVPVLSAHEMTNERPLAWPRLWPCKGTSSG